jgi:hypothetical protein
MPTAFVRSASALDTSVPRRAAVDEHRNAIADFGDDFRQRFDRRGSRFRRSAAAIRLGDAVEAVRYWSCWWWAHLVGALRVHPHQQDANYPAQKDGGLARPGRVDAQVQWRVGDGSVY